jgi:glycosyltransferase involved in cell wall biosynthesis
MREPPRRWRGWRLVCAPVRLAVFTDYVYRERAGRLYSERAFTLFVARLGTLLDRLVLVGRFGPSSDAAPYRLPDEVEFVGLPYYPRLGPATVFGAFAGTMRQFWRALDGVDCVWLLGPHPFALPFAVIAALRRRRIVLGVRQEFREYIGNRHPGRPLWKLAALVLEGSFRLLARRCDTIVVGPELARQYRHARRLLEINVSLVPQAEVVDPGADGRSYDGELRLLSVGRLETEKNPLLLAEVLAELAGDGRGWSLRICGEGHLEGELEAKLAELGVAEHAELLGYVPFGEQLDQLYRSSHVLLHVSWTEGLPQILLEGFAAATPVVATDVGGVREAVGGAAVLVPPGDAQAAAGAVREVVDDPGLRARIRDTANRYALAHTAEAETLQVAEFLRRT